MFVAGATPRASSAVRAGTPVVSALAICAAEPGGLRSSVSSAAVSTAKSRVSVAPTTMPVVTPSFFQSTDSTAHLELVAEVVERLAQRHLDASDARP